MNYQRILKLQKLYGADKAQERINSGQIWLFEGSVGRYAMDLLRAGICMLPLHNTQDYYGNILPSRKQVRPRTVGSFGNCAEYWEGVDAGDIDFVEMLELISDWPLPF